MAIDRRLGDGPHTRHMSVQAWRRLRRSMTDGELRDLARDLVAFRETDEESSLNGSLAWALTTHPWEKARQR